MTDTDKISILEMCDPILFNGQKLMPNIKKQWENVMFSSQKDDWATPQHLFDELNKKFNFTLDPCANQHNYKCAKYFTKEINGLIQSWKGETVFCNPPYGREIYKWVKKAYDEFKSNNITVVMLIPARTDTKYFHEFIYNKEGVKIEFIKGRLKFGDSLNSAPFPSMIVTFSKDGIKEK